MRLDSMRSALAHASGLGATSSPVAEDLQAGVARLLGVELHADDVAALDRGAERHAVVADRHGVVDHRRGVRVREVDLRARRRRRPAAVTAAASSRLFQPTCGTFRRSARLADFAAELKQRPVEHAEAPARPAPRCCPRTATACRRRCRGAACRRRPRRESRAPASSSAARRVEVADARHDDAVRARRARPATVGVQTLRAEAASALRTEVRLPAP